MQRRKFGELDGQPVEAVTLESADAAVTVLTWGCVLQDWRVSPIRASDFRGLPPAFIVAAGVDILRDDIDDYARLLRDAGVATQVSRYDTTIHGFIAMAGEIEAGRIAIAECAHKLRTALYVGR